jgi:hypothetical protein
MNEIHLMLSEKERDLLQGMLDTELGDVRSEIRHTDSSPDFRAELGAREALVRQLLDKLKLTAV